MRSKEEENDYRYFPEPDLPVLMITQDRIGRLRESLPELPWQKLRRFIEQYGLPEYDASVLSSSGEVACFYEEVARVTGKPKESSNWIMGEVMRIMNEGDLSIESLGLKPEYFKELFEMIDSGRISNSIAKEILPEVIERKRSPASIVKEKGLEQINDDGVIETAIREAMESNPKAVQQFREGKEGVLGYFVGAVMKATRGKANPARVNEMARRLLKD
ncbi:MAG: Asp-tRNA(Asn)/Glu-tRNA(Gln) amidotransferase GatCAB subunit B, partial [Mesotoga sp.]|nr:Asp-tRNA(Asn)/Glu-tRNA(Gln) amidotransferase GatCAB subunit B [Mesotoga sp.]